MGFNSGFKGLMEGPLPAATDLIEFCCVLHEILANKHELLIFRCFYVFITYKAWQVPLMSRSPQFCVLVGNALPWTSQVTSWHSGIA